jgi:hypothetical protein
MREREGERERESERDGKTSIFTSQTRNNIKIFKVFLSFLSGQIETLKPSTVFTTLRKLQMVQIKGRRFGIG